MTNPRIVASPEDYAAAGAANTPPPPITSDPLVAGGVPMEQLLRVLGLAANLGDPADNGESQSEQEKRAVKTSDAEAKFPANEENSAAELKAVAEQGQAAQMAQSVPQMMSGLAGAVAGAIGGALGPLTQIPQQVSQAGQQAMQMGMGALPKEAGVTNELSDAALFGDELGDQFGTGEGELGDGGGGSDSGGGGAALLGGTTPTAMLGPPAVPSASTFPASSPALPTTTPSAPAPTTTPVGGMGGVPMVPPGAMHGATGAGNDSKPDTKRIAVPSVKNGAPVQGRFSTPPAAPMVTKRVEGKPVATKRIVTPDSKPDEKS